MLYQIFYDEKSLETVQNSPDFVKPMGVYDARHLKRPPDYIYDDEQTPNLTEHNTLCEWRALYFIWKHHPSAWVGFTSWQHDRKGFTPKLHSMDLHWIERSLRDMPIAGFIVKPLKHLIVMGVDKLYGITLKSQFLQWSLLEQKIKGEINDTRAMPLGRYHHERYWDFIINEYRNQYGVNLDKEIDWLELGRYDFLHTWCNAFVTRWDYFDAYMRQFSPIVMNLLEYFGSHPIDLELSYICERLIILFNYIRFADNNFIPSTSESAISGLSTKGGPAVQEKAAAANTTNPAATASSNDKRTMARSAAKSISIITCSVDDKKFDAFQDNVYATFGQDTQLIRVADARSLSEGYNRGVGYASGDTLIFCHDDIRFLEDSTPAIVRHDLEHNDIVGVAGTTKLVTGRWYAAGRPFTHGQVIHTEATPSGDSYQLCQYGMESDNVVVKGIQAVDGLFFAAKRSVLDHVQFDEQLFDGFHLYDLDFTYAAYLKGMRIAVDYRILLVHFSGGNYDHNWKRYAQRFDQKYAGRLAPKDPKPNCTIKYYSAKSLDSIKQIVRLNLDSGYSKEQMTFRC